MIYIHNVLNQTVLDPFVYLHAPGYDYDNDTCLLFAQNIPKTLFINSESDYLLFNIISNNDCA